MSSSTNGATNGTAKPTERKITAETYGTVDASQVNNEVWMIRMPPKLAQVWNDAPEGTVLGELVFTKGGKLQNGKTIKPSLKVNASQDVVSQSDVPLEYTMEAMTRRVPTMHPFVRHPNGSVEIGGTVTRTANLQMQTTDERYRLYNKKRIMETNVTSNRFVKPVEQNEVSVGKSHSAALASSTKGFGTAVQQFGQARMEANEGGSQDADASSRKRKFQGQSTQSVVFELFSQQPYWSVKEIKQVSGRPEKEIRQVLAEIGEFHKRGDHQGKWELRDEFKEK